MSAVADIPTADGADRGRSRRGTRHVTGGVLWIAMIGVLLAGVVALNVVVLQLNVAYDELGSERIELQADIARLRSQLSSTAATARVERVAREEIGLVESDPATSIYVRLTPEAP